MNINNFDSFIDKKILARGRDYFEDGCVLSIKETGHNEYEAEVEGTELYSVEIEIDDEGNIIETVCNCPYDTGEYCKHQVAVFLILRDMKNNLTREGNSTPQTSAAASKPIRNILAARTKEELVEFLVNVADEYEEIRQRIELDFFDGSDEEEIRQSIKLIRAYIGMNSDRHGLWTMGILMRPSRAPV